MSVLFYKVMRYSVAEPKHPANDRFILSKVSYCCSSCSLNLPSLLILTFPDT